MLPPFSILQQTEKKDMKDSPSPKQLHLPEALRTPAARLTRSSDLRALLENAVEQTSKALQKEVRLVQNIRVPFLDEAISARILDSLSHLIRNAIDHGIESAEERLERGKPRAGVIRISLFSTRETCVVTCQDDGQGIDAQKVIRRAEELGLNFDESRSEVNVSEEKQALRLILLPGLSTLSAPSLYSGRGIGMDLVRSEIEGMGGRIRVRSRQGSGTQIRMEIPLRRTAKGEHSAP